jgi:Ca2+-binding EF-hand superfamily protein
LDGGAQDGGGTISAKELSELLSVLGLTVSDAEVQQMIAEIDVDGNGSIDFEEFAEVSAVVAGRGTR